MTLDHLLVMSQFHRLHKRKMLTALERSSFSKWNSSHIGILSMLAEEPKATAELSELIGITKQATSQCIRELADRQLVGIRGRSTHVRVQLVYLTASGWAFLANWMEESAALDRHYADLVGADALQQVKDTLFLAVDTFGEP